MVDAIRVLAPAKVNLSLAAHGRRADGYHELTSLVVFADACDVITLEPSDTFSLTVTGPMAGRIDGPNLISQAAEKLADLAPDIAPGRVSLEKHLPVGAGVGGGSADAAAYLRAVRKANPQRVDDFCWDKLALSLGADVPVCFHNRTTWMCGIGERLVAPDSDVPVLHVVLVNPGIAVATGAVFTALSAGPTTTEPRDFACPSLRNGIDALTSLSNDLEAPALAVVPEIMGVRRALEATDEVRLVRMSGSGATYFGLYDDADAAKTAARDVSDAHPDWWVVPTQLGGAINSHG